MDPILFSLWSGWLSTGAVVGLSLIALMTMIERNEFSPELPSSPYEVVFLFFVAVFLWPFIIAMMVVEFRRR